MPSPKTTGIVAAAAIATGGALGNWAPSWISYLQSGNPADIVSSQTVAAAIGKKPDAINGHLQNPNIQGGTATGTDVTSSLINKIPISSVFVPCSSTSSNCLGIKTATNTNFSTDYSTDYINTPEQTNLPTASIPCPEVTGPTNGTVSCASIVNTGIVYPGRPNPTAQNLNFVQMADAKILGVGQYIGTNNHSATMPLWAQNTVMNQDPGTADLYGYEMDINREMPGCSVPLDVIVGTANGCSKTIGFWATGLNVNKTTGGYAFFATMSGAGSNSTPLWADGYATVANSIRDSSFLDNSGGHATLRAYNGHWYGTDFSNASFSGAALLLPDTTVPDVRLSNPNGLRWTGVNTASGSPTYTASISVGGGNGVMAIQSNGGYNFNAAQSGATGFEIGSLKTAASVNIDYHTSGTGSDYDIRWAYSGTGNTDFWGNRLTMHAILSLDAVSKATIMSIANPQEGDIVNDKDDHVPVVYENGHWYPIQLGAALQ